MLVSYLPFCRLLVEPTASEGQLTVEQVNSGADRKYSTLIDFKVCLSSSESELQIIGEVSERLTVFGE